ncbi:hypothetical protein CWI75_08740 [Kineobactrum sediminis]|uniref:Uncharacterized protein n=1 Tax=Kineobactrum sediminis TaxID=1905677 RepID=A0A2N5Y2N1_9GAMM|nr:hypothetical protein [Kineobactrum sediminis]PLW82661.1 hypothetical protein CWI75_08740 [Kineobactrum sediminis]
MNLSLTEDHLKLWGSKLYRNRSSGLGYSRSPLGRTGPGSGIPDELYQVDAAVSLLANVDPLRHKILIDHYGRGFNWPEVGERNPDESTGKPRTRDTVARLAAFGLGFIAGQMTNNP